MLRKQFPCSLRRMYIEVMMIRLLLRCPIIRSVWKMLFMPKYGQPVMRIKRMLNCIRVMETQLAIHVLGLLNLFPQMQIARS